MKISEIKKSLQESIDTGDEELLHILYATAAAYKKQHEKPYELTQWQRDELDRRLEANEPSIPWEVVKNRILSSKRPK